MISSLRDFLPMEALAPVLGGLLLWFGFNYIVLAPNVIVPRLAEKYYVPACVTSVKNAREAAIERFKKEEAEYMVTLNKWMVEQNDKMKAAAGNLLGQILGNYGAQGQAYVQQHGKELGGWLDKSLATASPALVQRAQQALTEWKSGKQKEIASLRSQQKFSDPAAFCGCNVGAAMSNNIDLALYTSSLRLLKPKSVSELENGRVFEAECGKIPVV